MQLDLVLSDLAMVLREFDELQILEGHLAAINSKISEIENRGNGDLDISFVDDNDLPDIETDHITTDHIINLDDIKLIDTEIPQIKMVVNEPDIKEDYYFDDDTPPTVEENIIKINLDGNDILVLGNNDFSNIDPIQDIGSARQKLEEALAHLGNLINQLEQPDVNATSEEDNLLNEKAIHGQNYADLVSKENIDHHNDQTDLTNNLNRLNTTLAAKQAGLARWWKLPEIIPPIFKGSLDAIQQLTDQISAKSMEIQNSNASHQSMISWYQTERDAVDREIEAKLSILRQTGHGNIQTLNREIQTIYQACQNDLIPQYRRNLNLCLEKIQAILIAWHPDCNDGVEFLRMLNYKERFGVRVGILLFDNFEKPIPAVLDPFGNRKHIFIKGGSIASRNKVLQSIFLRILASFSPGMVRFHFIDRLEQGRALNLYATKLDKDIAYGKVFDEDGLIEEEITDLKEKISQINRFVLVEHNNIDDYNKANPDIPTPYYFIVASNFPHGFSSRTLQFLTDILKNGPHAGIYFIASVDDLFSPSRDFDLNAYVNGNYLLDIDESSEKITWNNEYISSLSIKADNLLDVKQISGLLQEINKIYQEKPMVVEYERISRTLPAQFWTGSSANGMASPVGLTFGGKLHEIEFNDSFVHGLIGGRPGTGKTVLMHDLICGLAQLYSPDEVSFYLLDFKGTEFDVYAKNKLPHAKVVAVDCDPEVGLDILKGLNSEMEYRIKLFQDFDVEDIKAYRQKIGKISRILLIIDEVQSLITKTPDLSQLKQFENELIELLKKGRAFGIHVLLGTQSPTNVLGNQMLQQIAIRICLLADPSVSRLVLGETNEDAKNLQKQGEAVFNAYNGIPDKNVLIRAALLKKEKIASIVEALNKYSMVAVIEKPVKMDYFDGRTISKLVDHDMIQSIITKLPDTKSRKLIIPLGNALGPKEDIGFLVERRKISNTIFVGGEPEELHAIFCNSLMALCIQTSISDAQFFIIDLTYSDLPYANILWAFRNIPHEKEFARNTDSGVDIILSVYEILNERKKESRGGSRNEKSVYLIIYGAENFNDLRGKDRYEKTELRKKIEEILRDGPPIGIHTFLASQTLSRSEIIAADEFGNRICMQMTEDDSRILLDSDAGTKLTKKRAIFRRKEWPMKKVDKFKPYLALDETSITIILNKLTIRENGSL